MQLPVYALAVSACLGLAACSAAHLRPVAVLADSPPAASPAPVSAVPWWRSAVFYEVFVRSFQDSNGDGVGDLDGVTSRLDYLSSLGVSGLWLMPIFPSPSYHGYDVTDYAGVNQQYGDAAALGRLLTAAHAKGLHVILDIPLNHTSSSHPWFLAGLEGPTAPERQRYVWRDAVPNWPAIPDNAAHWHQVGAQYYFSFFSENMPDLNWDDPDVYADLVQALIHWTALGVDGFRLDAARYLVEGPLGESDTAATHQLWQRIVRDVKAAAPATMFVGEVWADQATIDGYYGAGDELDQCFGFPLAGGLVDAVHAADPAAFVQALGDELAAKAPAYFSAPFLTNHDQVRAATTLGGDVAKLKLAAAALLTLPGTPYLYYGEEIGMPDGTLEAHKGDLAKRTPMLWDPTAGHGFTTAGAPWLAYANATPGVDAATEQADPQSLFQTYRQLLALRQQEPAFAAGDTAFATSDAAQVVAYTRRTGDETLLVVLNFGGALKAATHLSLPWAGNAAPALLYGQADPVVTVSGAAATVTLPTLPAAAAVVVRLTPVAGLGAD